MALNAVDPATVIASSNAGKGPVLQVIIPQDMAKVKDYKGAKFLNTKMTAWASEAKPIDIIYAGRQTPLNIPILFGAPEPDAGQGQSSSKRSGIGLSLPTCGETGAALEIMEHEFLAQVQNPATLKKLWTDDTPPQFPCHIKRIYGKKCKDQTKKGQRRDEALVDLKVEFGRFSDKYFKKVLAGKPKSTVYDWSSRSVDAAGQEVFSERTDNAGQTINVTNASQILATGDIIRRVALMVDGVSISDRGIALRVSIYKAWTERPKGDINYIPAPGAAAPAPAASVAPAAPAVPKKPNADDEGIYDDDNDSQ